MVWRLLLLWPIVLAAQSTGPSFLGRPITMLPPAVDGSGQKVVFGSALTPEGAAFAVTDVYAVMTDGAGLRRLTRITGPAFPPLGATDLSLIADGSRAAYTALLPTPSRFSEEVRVLDLSSGADRTVAVDKEGCIQPLCPNCFLTCVNTPHLTPDGSGVLYSAPRQQPFYVANVDGTGVTRLPTYSGGLARGPQRVISSNGLVVFTSSAPAGPTFAASATDVYLMNLDGTNIQAVTHFGNDPSLFAWNAVISADGSTIAFESNRDPDSGKPGETLRVWVVHSDGAGLRPLTTGSEPSTGPSISADGELVGFVHKGQIYLASSGGASLQALTDFQMSAAQDPVISDDGSRVVFTIGPRNGGRGAIYVVDSDGKNLRPLYAPRALSQGSITGAAAGAAPSPGSLITAYGTNLAVDGLSTASGFPLPESLAGVSLLVNGRPAPMLAVTPWQVNAQLPPEIPEGPAAFQFRFADGTPSAPSAADVKSYAPAIFSSLPEDSCHAAALHIGTGVLADQDHPAAIGEAIEIYGIGLGPVDPFVPAGVAAPASPPAAASLPEVFIGGLPAEVLFAGLAPGLAGVYQVNAVVPSWLKPDAQFVEWRAGGVSSSGCTTIWVK